MYRILVPIDGSDCALRALAHAVRLARLIGKAEIHLLNVQPNIPAAVGDFVGSEAIARYRAEESGKALLKAREQLDGTGIAYRAETRVGGAGETISNYAQEAACDAIVMGTRGLGRLSGLILGSVATQVLHLAEVPLTLIK